MCALVMVTRGVTSPHGVAAGAGHMADEASLQQRLLVVRRLDWRFLLPEPALGRVGYAGPPEGALVEALRVFSQELVLLDMEDASTPDASLDRVVLKDAPVRALRRAARCLCPAGYVYAEYTGRRVHPWWVRRAASRTGFAAAHIHWHWPDFETCTRMIPANEVGAMTHALVKGKTGPKAYVMRLAVGGLGRSGLLGWVWRDFSLVARRI